MKFKSVRSLLIVYVSVLVFYSVRAATSTPALATTAAGATNVLAKQNTVQSWEGSPLELKSGSLQPGIKIISATYGAPGTPGKDVTELLQKQVKSDATSVILSNATVANAGSSWQNALFGDPAVGTRKILNVTWQAAQDTLPSLIDKLPHGKAVYIKQNSSGKYLKAVYNKNKGKWTVSFDGTKQDVNTKFYIYKFEDDDAICFTKPFTQGTEKIHLMINFDGITQKIDLIGARNDPTCQWKVLGKSLSDCMLLNFDVQEQIDVLDQNFKDHQATCIQLVAAVWKYDDGMAVRQNRDVTPSLLQLAINLGYTPKTRKWVFNNSLGTRFECGNSGGTWQTKFFPSFWEGSCKRLDVAYLALGEAKYTSVGAGQELVLEIDEKKHPAYGLPSEDEIKKKLEILKKASTANMNMSLELATPKKSQKTSDDSTVTSDEASD